MTDELAPQRRSALEHLAPDELLAMIEKQREVIASAGTFDARGVARELERARTADGRDVDEAEVARTWERVRKGLPEPLIDVRGRVWTAAQVEQMRRDGVAEDGRRTRD